MSQPTTAPLLAGLQAAQQARPTTPTNQQVDPCYYGGFLFVSPQAARAARARQDDLEHAELRARIAGGAPW